MSEAISGESIGPVSTAGIEVQEFDSDSFENVTLETAGERSLDEIREALVAKIEELKEIIKPFDGQDLSGEQAREVEATARELHIAESRLAMIDLNKKITST